MGVRLSVSPSALKRGPTRGTRDRGEAAWPGGPGSRKDPGPRPGSSARPLCHLGRVASPPPALGSLLRTTGAATGGPAWDGDRVRPEDRLGRCPAPSARSPNTAVTSPASGPSRPRLTPHPGSLPGRRGRVRDIWPRALPGRSVLQHGARVHLSLPPRLSQQRLPPGVRGSRRVPGLGLRGRRVREHGGLLPLLLQPPLVSTPARGAASTRRGVGGRGGRGGGGGAAGRLAGADRAPSPSGGSPEDHSDPDVHVDVCWHGVTDYACRLPAGERRTTYTECCCQGGEAWSQQCSLCPPATSGEAGGRGGTGRGRRARPGPGTHGSPPRGPQRSSPGCATRAGPGLTSPTGGVTTPPPDPSTRTTGAPRTTARAPEPGTPTATPGPDRRLRSGPRGSRPASCPGGQVGGGRGGLGSGGPERPGGRGAPSGPGSPRREASRSPSGSEDRLPGPGRRTGLGSRGRGPGLAGSGERSTGEQHLSARGRDRGRSQSNAPRARHAGPSPRESPISQARAAPVPGGVGREERPEGPGGGERRVEADRAAPPVSPPSPAGVRGGLEGPRAEECGVLNGCENGRCVRVPEGYTCDCSEGYRLDTALLACVGERSPPGPGHPPRPPGNGATLPAGPGSLVDRIYRALPGRRAERHSWATARDDPRPDSGLPV
uniref:EGF-like domain-containing protein n=1 Tax=Ornithorhynchus anatinus TaxID=9258 RepID=A0A6I8NJE5_ORNAN